MSDDNPVVIRAEPPTPDDAAHEGAVRSTLPAVACVAAAGSAAAAGAAMGMADWVAGASCALVATVLLVIGLLAWRRPSLPAPDVFAVAVIVLVASEGVVGLVSTDRVDWSLAVIVALAAAGSALLTLRWLVAAVYTVWVGWLAGLAAADLGGWPVGWLIAALTVTAIGAVSSVSRRNLTNELADIATTAERAAVRDPLTGLVNRRGLSLLGQQIVEAARRSGDAVHCVYIDIDQLRHVNEVAGHESGDDVVVAVSDALRSVTRGTDIVARWGGDEFCIIGPGSGMSPVELERRLRERLLLSPPVGLDVWEPKVCAGGAMLAPWDSGSLDTLLGKADQEMYLRRALRRGGPRNKRAAPSDSENEEPKANPNS
ncbi:MAG TPA: GGDEF domain-containing protein [Actinomycetes bacterium]|nr:GGDEF domain-containing protein [Actinomycetes bacterium]